MNEISSNNPEIGEGEDNVTLAPTFSASGTNLNDSTAETMDHIRLVQFFLGDLIQALQVRLFAHDASKLLPPEKPYFDKYTPLLKTVAYGSDEYTGFLEAMEPALDHHYANNRHHPQHFASGMRDMNLLDICEMFVDWLAATKRSDSGDIRRSININQKRFGYPDYLADIFRNTADYFDGLTA